MIGSRIIVLTHDSPDFIKHVQPLISLDPKHKHEIASTRLDVHNSISNIDRKHSCIHIRVVI